jgi:hypothetical protein
VGKGGGVKEAPSTNLQALELRIVLDRDNFRALVNGEVVQKEGAKLILSDIGFEVMLLEVTAAIRKGAS